MKLYWHNSTSQSRDGYAILRSRSDHRQSRDGPNRENVHNTYMCHAHSTLSHKQLGQLYVTNRIFTTAQPLPVLPSRNSTHLLQHNTPFTFLSSPYIKRCQLPSPRGSRRSPAAKRLYHNTMKPNIPVLDWMFSSSSWFVHLQNKQNKFSTVFC